jgi:hypothetical protein
VFVCVCAHAYVWNEFYEQITLNCSLLLCLLVCTSLIANGERQEEDNVGGRIRMQALSMLCQMNPVQALAIRAKCVCTSCFILP